MSTSRGAAFERTPTRSVAVIGLGSMGGAMAHTLVRTGWDVRGYDPAAAARESLTAAGGRPTDDLTELAGTPYVVLSLPSAAIVATTVPVLLAKPGTIAILDTTTSDPATTAAMVDLAHGARAHFVDAPVSGGHSGAIAGQLSAFVGGSPESVAAAKPILQELTNGTFRHLGPAGSGNVVKLLNNVLCATNLVAVGEALDIAAAYGIDLDVTADALSNASGGSFVSANAFPNWIFSGTFQSGFSLGLMARDVRLALDVGAQRGAHPALLSQTNSAWQRALELLGATADFSETPGTVTTATTALNPQSIRDNEGLRQ